VKTIKQIADDIGVSKQKVYRYIRANKIKETNRLQVHNGKRKHETLYYDESLEAQIKSHFDVGVMQCDAVVDVESTSNDAASDAKTTSHDAGMMQHDAIVDAVINMLKQELEIKNKQIDDLSSALIAAQQTAAAAQALHAGTINHLTSTDEKKPGFFSRLFKRI